MSEEAVIGAGSPPDGGGEDEPMIGGQEQDPPEGDGAGTDIAGMLRESLLAAHDDLSAEDLAGESADEVRERYVAARARLDQEAREATGPQVPAGAPGRFAPAPGTAFEKIREGLGRLGA